jgi:hypothetical protein
VLDVKLGRPAALKARCAHILEMIMRFCVRPERFGEVPELTNQLVNGLTAGSA